MAKNNRSGKAAIFTVSNYRKLIAATKNPKWRLFFQIAWHTGERSGAIAQLRVSDVFDSQGEALEHITYRASTRKRGAGKLAKTRQVPVNATLRAILEAYKLGDSEFLFPGESQDSPIAKVSVQAAFRRYIEQAGLSDGGFSTHSFRRTFITRMAHMGINPRVMQEITGHRNIRNVMEYVDVTPEQIKQAVLAMA